MSWTRPNSIVIVGGGTAGWMAANLVAHRWGAEGVAVTLVESRDIGTIGVGEGSTPVLRDFFRELGIPDSEWMPACNATYKAGISFPGWSTLAGFASYFHPFFSPLDRQTAPGFFDNCVLARRGLQADCHPDDFFVAAELARQGKAPLPRQALPFQPDYAYHFDAGLLAAFLRDRATGRGVRHIVDSVLGVHQDDSGAITSLSTALQGALDGDFFIDCSGFAALLIGKTLREPFHSYADSLLNDRAVAIPTPSHDCAPLPSHTESRALRCGWAWRIPLTSRFGNGYVYSSAHVTPEQAEQELRADLGAEAKDSPALHLRMRIGRVGQHWSHNCLAAGLSQGFIEPLEATALMLVQFTLSRFLDQFAGGAATDVQRQDFNREINRMFDGVRDYVVTHYKLNSRDDSDYWRANREETRTPDSVAALLAAWDSPADFDQALARQAAQQVYLRPSWYCIFAGMGRFPAIRRPARAGLAVPGAGQRARCRHLADLFPDHRLVLRGTAPAAIG